MADADTSFEDDVPPLEDMSDVLHQIRTTHHKEASTTNLSSAGEKEKSPSLARNTVKTENSVEQNLKPSNQNINGQNKSKSFAGLKKGFLFGTPSNPKKVAKQENNLPFIKPEKSAQNANSLRIDEVQEAMKLGESFVENKDWLTEDLISKVQKNERLVAQMADERFMQAMTDFQRNPHKALNKYKDNPEVQQFLAEFSKLLGGHFEQLAKSEETIQSKNLPSQKRSKNIASSEGGSTPPISREDENKLQEIMSDPQVREALMDERIQKLLAELRVNPDQAQMALKAADSDIQQKVRRLVGAGLLQFQA